MKIYFLNFWTLTVYKLMSVLYPHFCVWNQVLFGKGKDRNLLKDLKSELGGSYEKLVMSCYESAGEFDAKQVLAACNGVGFNSDLLIEVVCTRTNEQIASMKSAWSTSLRQGKSMAERVRSETKKMMSSNNFQPRCSSRHRDAGSATI